MVASKHPDARAVAAKQQLIQQQMRTLQRLATSRQQRLMESMYRHEYFLESAELEQWIREQVQSAASEDYGQDYEHLQVSVWANTCPGCCLLGQAICSEFWWDGHIKERYEYRYQGSGVCNERAQTGSSLVHFWFCSITEKTEFFFNSCCTCSVVSASFVLLITVRHFICGIHT
jgi:hypothetical protein